MVGFYQILCLCQSGNKEFSFASSSAFIRFLFHIVISASSRAESAPLSNGTNIWSWRIGAKTLQLIPLSDKTLENADVIPNASSDVSARRVIHAARNVCARPCFIAADSGKTKVVPSVSLNTHIASFISSPAMSSPAVANTYACSCKIGFSFISHSFCHTCACQAIRGQIFLQKTG